MFHIFYPIDSLDYWGHEWALEGRWCTHQRPSMMGWHEVENFQFPHLSHCSLLCHGAFFVVHSHKIHRLFFALVVLYSSHFIFNDHAAGAAYLVERHVRVSHLYFHGFAFPCHDGLASLELGSRSLFIWEYNMLVSHTSGVCEKLENTDGMVILSGYGFDVALGYMALCHGR